MSAQQIGWGGIFRLGLVQMSLGSIVVLTTSTLNRIMVVELGLAALLPGALVALHYFVQLSRPRFGHGSDRGQRRTPWIIGGIALLAIGALLATAATALMSISLPYGIGLAVIAFILIGAGVGASGTCLLVLLSSCVDSRRKPAAASITFIMMIFGFALTAGVVGSILDPFSFTRLLIITACVGSFAILTSSIALHGIEQRFSVHAAKTQPAEDTTFREALNDVIREAHTRRFALFVFVSMLAYSAQDLVLEPFAGAVFNLTPGESTQLGGTQHAGVLIGMLMVAFVGYFISKSRDRLMRICMMSGCIGSAILLIALAASAYSTVGWPLSATVFALGVANGTFAVAAIACMMHLVSSGRQHRDGVRMGVWGAAQAIAFGTGGILGTLAVDVVRILSGSVVHAYAMVFVIQAILFSSAAVLAIEVSRHRNGMPTTAGANA